MNLSSFNPINWFRKFSNWLDTKHWLLQTIIMLGIVFFVRTYFFGLYWVPTGSMEPTILVGESFFADKFTPMFTEIKRGEIISFNEPEGSYKYSDNPIIYLFEKYVYGPQNWTKRVIGVPGDHVEGKLIDGRPEIFINGVRLDQPYVNNYPIVAITEEAYQLGVKPPFLSKQIRSACRVYDPILPITSPDQPFYIIEKKELFPNSEMPLIHYPHTKTNEGCGVMDDFDVTLGKDEYFGCGDNRQGSYDSRGFGKIKRDQIHGRIVFRLFSIKSPNSLIYDLFFHPIDFFTKKLRSWDRWFCRVK
jgi:signal peptidase I